MYTQCHECGVAFRVTADILKQAAGQIRCGGCGIVFNALAHLSEQKPSAPVQSVSLSEPQIPELEPEEPGDLDADTPQQSISAEQNVALLRTLDQLAGSDIRIEDTGAEWRVLDDDDVADEPAVDAPVSDDPLEVVDKMRFDDDTPLPDDFDSGSEPPPPTPVIEAAEHVPDPEDSQVDLAFGDPNEWENLLGDLNEVESEEKSPGENLLVPAESHSASAPDGPLDMDTQFAIQAEAMGIDLSGLHEVVDDEAEVDEEEIELELDAVLKPEDEVEDDVEDIAVDFDKEVETVIDTIVSELDSKGNDKPDEFSDTADASDEYEVPEMTEEEETLNMMIDQELFNIAVEDEDGFTPSVVQVQPEKKVGKVIDDNLEAASKDEAPLFETIIMEGDIVRSQQDKEKLAVDKSAWSGRFDTTSISIPSKKTTLGALRHGRRQTGPPGTGTIVGIVALLLLLILQVMHQSREALATVPAFNQAVGPVYRMLGKPMTPTWDISGWRFEATKGSTEAVGKVDDSGETVENDEVLTIYSRVGNNSDKALPYPLVHLSLTDRFEEIIGSRVLEPGEYLAVNTDPRKPVPPGNTFNAVISIKSPSEEAIGFKLNVCYRLASGQLRCAIEDFK